LIPIIIVAVVIGSVIAFAVFSTTITTPAKIFSNMTEITETNTTPPRGIARMMIYSLNQTRYEKSI
jgi:hypothetical protein